MYEKTTNELHTSSPNLHDMNVLSIVLQISPHQDPTSDLPANVLTPTAASSDPNIFLEKESDISPEAETKTRDQKEIPPPHQVPNTTPAPGPNTPLLKDQVPQRETGKSTLETFIENKERMERIALGLRRKKRRSGPIDEAVLGTLDTL